MRIHPSPILLGALVPTLCSPACQTPPADTAEPRFEERDLFVGGEDGYDQYRIPALIEGAGGVLLAFAEGRQGLRDDGDIDLVMKRSFDGGATWSALEVVVDVGSETAGNPAPVLDRSTGAILLPFCTNPGDAPDERRVWITRSTDDGEIWSDPRDITAEVKPEGWTWYATGPGRSVQLASGRLVVPADHHDSADGTDRSHVIWSDDGERWQVGGSIEDGTDEAQVAELPDGRLVMNARDLTDAHRRAVAYSEDAGLTWGPTLRDPALPDPSCQGSLLATPQGLLFANPASEVALVRERLTVRLSSDGGETWPVSRVLHEGPAAYSALAALPDGALGCLYEQGDQALLPYDRLTFAAFTLGWLEP